MTPNTETYIEAGLYSFVRDKEGNTEPANGSEPDGWCLYLLERKVGTHEFVKELYDKDFEDTESAFVDLEALYAKYGHFEVEVY